MRGSRLLSALRGGYQTLNSRSQALQKVMLCKTAFSVTGVTERRTEVVVDVSVMDVVPVDSRETISLTADDIARSIVLQRSASASAEPLCLPFRLATIRLWCSNSSAAASSASAEGLIDAIKVPKNFEFEHSDCH